jgi:diguanylate cyclase (GGDEF)-like protein
VTINEIISLLNADPSIKLTALQEAILRLAWRGLTYTQMEIELHYQDSYLKNLARELWLILSQIFGEPIGKKNFVSTLQNRMLTGYQERLLEPITYASRLTRTPEPHYGPVPLASSFYLERPAIEDLAYTEIEKPGGVLRIKAPAKMGKTSLLIRLLHQASARDYRTVTLNLDRVDRGIFDDLDRFLRWLCTNISRQLELEPKLEEYWEDVAGSKVSCSLYFRNYLLPAADKPLILALDEAHQLLEYPHLVRDFFPLLRTWHEESKIVPIWQKLRLIVVHSTDIYVPLGLNQSPFNVGLTLTLPEFTLDQIQELARRYGIDWADESGAQKAMTLMRMIGGHPYHAQFAFYHLRWRQTNLETLLESAPTSNGIYSDHLRYLASILQDHPELFAAWAKVIESPTPVQIEGSATYQLESLGLVRLEPSGVVPNNDLYRLYFQAQFPHGNYTRILENYIAQLKQENQRLLALCLTDELTGLGNRTGFERRLTHEWRRSARSSRSLSLLFCEIDDFDTYPEWGESQSYLQQVGRVLITIARRAADYIARYEAGKFAFLLPETNEEGARTVAEALRSRLARLEIFLEDAIVTPVTVSIGITCQIATVHDSPASFERLAQKALAQSRSAGGNRMTVLI